MKLTKTIVGVLLLGGVALSASGSITVRDGAGKTTVYGDDMKTIAIDRPGIFDVTGSDPARVEDKRIVVNISCTLILKNINLKNTRDGVSTIEVNGSARLLLEVDGKNIISSGHGAAGILVTENATLRIDRADGAPAADSVLYVSCGQNGAAIGAAGPYGSVLRSVNGGTIIVQGATVVAQRSDARADYWCDGLGGAFQADCKRVEVNGGTLDIQTPGSICATDVVINGGSVCLVQTREGIRRSVNGRRVDILPVNPNGEPLMLAKLPVDTGILGDTGLQVEVLNENYGTRDVFPVGDPQSHGKSLYLYLTKKPHRIKVTSGKCAVDYTIGWTGGGFTVKSKVTTVASVLLDGVLKDPVRPVANTNATASVTVDGELHELAFTTDERGVFVVVLPAEAASSPVELKNVKVGGKTTTFTATLNVPQLPYALGAEMADEVVADGDITVVDAQVTVEGDLTVQETATVNTNTLFGGVKGGITVGQASPAKEHELKLDENRNANTVLHWIGEPITVLDAHAKGQLKISSRDVDGHRDSIYLYLMEGRNDKIIKRYTTSYGKWCEFNIPDVKNFAFEELTDRKPFIEPDLVKNLYNQRYEYKAKSDGFIVVEIEMPEDALGGVAVMMDFCNNLVWHGAFGSGWHRGPLPRSINSTPGTPAFRRVYTHPMRQGDEMHMRLLWESYGYNSRTIGEFYMIKTNADGSGYSDIDLRVKVKFYPIGGSGEKEVTK